jgi:hypothetical protein
MKLPERIRQFDMESAIHPVAEIRPIESQFRDAIINLQLDRAKGISHKSSNPC